MVTFRFIGRVLPENFPISVTAPPIRIENVKNQLDVTMELSIAQSIISIDGIANRYEKGDFGLMYRRAVHLANSAVDMVAFSTGSGLRAILDRFVQPDGIETPIFSLDSRLAGLCTAYSLRDGDENFDAVFTKVATTPNLFLALNDLIIGLYQPDEAAIVPARAIETIRRIFAPEDAKPADQWRYMHEALRLTKEYLEPITEISKNPRHGARTGPLDGDILVVSERTWVVMNRCLEYFKRGGSALPENEFPVL